MISDQSVNGAHDAVQTFKGSCHCGRVTFEADASPTKLTDCNCSICYRKGAIYIQSSEVAAMRILSGESELSVYQFNTRTASHYFCRTCGIHPFHRPRFAPERWSVNTRCLDDFDISAYGKKTFDGRNWEQAADAETRRTAAAPNPDGHARNRSGR